MQRTALLAIDVFILLCLLSAAEKIAYGYVDPGQGLLALQSIASAAAAAGYLFRRRLRAFFRRGAGPKSAV